MHFEALHHKIFSPDVTEDLTIAGMCNLIQFLLSSHSQKAYFLLKRYGMGYLHV